MKWIRFLLFFLVIGVSTELLLVSCEKIDFDSLNTQSVKDNSSSINDENDSTDTGNDSIINVDKSDVFIIQYNGTKYYGYYKRFVVLCPDSITVSGYFFKNPSNTSNTKVLVNDKWVSSETINL